MQAAAEKRESSAPVQRRFRLYLISMLPLVGMTVYLYGLRPLVMTFLAVLLALASNAAVDFMRGRKREGPDLGGVVFAVTYVLMLPASARYGIVIFGTLLTLLVFHAFGGHAGCVFQPAAFGIAAAAVCWPQELFLYPRPFLHIGLGFSSGAILYEAPAYTIKNGGVPTIDGMDFLLGNYPGPMAATFCVVLIAILAFLISCRVITWHAPLTFLAAVAFFAFAFPRVASGMESVGYEMLSGIVVFGAVYIVSEPVTSPVNPKAKLLYGFLVGAATMLFNYFGAFQLGVSFAVLLINPLSSLLDRKLAPRQSAAREV